MQFFANSSESTKIFIVAWFTIIHSIGFVLFKDSRGLGFLDIIFCVWIIRQHLRCHHGNIFQSFDELFEGKSYIRMKQKNHLNNMSWFPFLFHTGRFKNMVDKLISVILDAAWQPININGENKWCLCTITNPNCWNNYKITWAWLFLLFIAKL